MNFEIIKKNYDMGLWNKEMVNIALDKNVITKEQYDKIIDKE